MSYTKTQLEALWTAENPGNGNPTLMAAIALAESSGNASVVNSIGACGLWQIHPYQNGCTSPTANARMAGEKLRSQGLSAWEAYTNGAYKQYLGNTRQDIGFGIPGIPGPSLPGLNIPEELLEGKVPNPLKPVEEGANTVKGAFGLLGKIPGDFDKIYHLLFTPAGWIRIGKVLLGVFLLLSGVMGMANVSAAPVVEVGKKGAEIAAVAAAA